MAYIWYAYSSSSEVAFEIGVLKHHRMAMV